MRHAQEILDASPCEGHESKYELMACEACLRSQAYCAPGRLTLVERKCMLTQGLTVFKTSWEGALRRNAFSIRCKSLPQQQAFFTIPEPLRAKSGTRFIQFGQLDEALGSRGEPPQ